MKNKTAEFILEPKLVGLENDILGFKLLAMMEYDELVEVVQGAFCMEWPLNYCLDFYLEKVDSYWFWVKHLKPGQDAEDFITKANKMLEAISIDDTRFDNAIETAMEINFIKMGNAYKQ